MCLICRSLFDDYDHQPKFLPCHHTFCKDCLREYVRQIGDEIECPSCRKVANVPAAGIAALQTNFYVKYIHSLVSSRQGTTNLIKECNEHPEKDVQFYCQECQKTVCEECCSVEDSGTCVEHPKMTITQVTEETHQKLDSTFAATNASIEAKKVKLERMLKNMAQEKDKALMKIDTKIEQYTHILHRRATLLKNKVIDIYNESEEKIEHDLMEISTALTCIVSLKDYHEGRISHGDYRDVDSGLKEMKEVNDNITEHIRLVQNHIVFEESHGAEKFKASTRDLGRVRCSQVALDIPVPLSPDTDVESPTLHEAVPINELMLGEKPLEVAMPMAKPADEYGAIGESGMATKNAFSQDDGMSTDKPTTVEDPTTTS